MPSPRDSFIVKIAETPDEHRAAQALRYDVFVRELGAGGALVDHEAGLERDAFDSHCDQMIACDPATGQVVGVYRLLRDDQAAEAGRFYSEGEYDLAPLRNSGRRLLELGRSCLHRDYRGGTVMYRLWSALADYVAHHRIDILFGVASFHGTDTARLAAPLSLLHHAYLAPSELRVRARPEGYHPMDLIAPDNLDRAAAMIQVPSLIKAYLRLGGVVGEGAFIDHVFNTTDVCLIVDTARMTEKAALYSGPRPR